LCFKLIKIFFKFIEKTKTKKSDIYEQILSALKMLLLRQRNLLSHAKVLTENVCSIDKLFSTAATTRASLVSEQLMSRAAVRVGGSEATAFLQGLITNDIHLLDKAKSMFTVFLNVQVYNLIGMI
jgi:hypothetical protein